MHATTANSALRDIPGSDPAVLAAEETGAGSDADSIVADILTIARSPAFGGGRDVAATSLADHLAAAEEALADLDIPQIIKPCTEEELRVARAGYDPDK